MIFEEISVIVDIIPHWLPGLSVWLGGSDQTAESAWGWLDDTPFSYINWIGLKSQGSKTFSCISMRIDNKYWISGDCDMKKPYVCKKLSKF